MNPKSYLLASMAAVVVATLAGAAVIPQAPVSPVPTPAVVTVSVTRPTAPAVITPTPTVQATTLASVASVRAATATAVVPLAVPALLKPLNLTDSALWNWNGKWMASEWSNANGPIPWKYDHVTQINRADTFFTLDAKGAPQLQALNGTTAYRDGLWEADVTLPKLKDGLIVAPLWLYDTASADEIDFEFAGRYGLDVTLHSRLNGVMQKSTARLFAGVDMSNQRKRFGIKVDQAAGYVEMYVDSRLVYRWNRSTMAFFISKPLKPWIEMWPANPSNSGFVQWAGKWSGLAAGERLSMTVHGYGYTPVVR